MLIEYGTIFFNIRAFPLKISWVRVTLKNKIEATGAMFNICVQKQMQGKLIMKRLLAIVGNILLFTVIFSFFGISYAEDKKFSEAELDQMVAPIALYPDSLLSQILMATTYPADVVEVNTEGMKWRIPHAV